MVSVQGLKDIANILRRDCLKMTTAAGSGHPTSCMSCAEIMSVLFFNELMFNPEDPDDPDNDEFILSKGHAAPILYSSLYRASLIKNDLMGLRKLNSPLEGHPMPRSLKWVKVATGSLGQGASVGVGMALAGKLSGRKYMTYVLLGDSEVSEGSIYEAMQLGARNKLGNLCLIVDVNRLGQRGETMVGHDMKKYAKRFNGFGWHTIGIDGHKIKSIASAFSSARNSKVPTIILAKTYKGKGVPFLEDRDGWHGKALNKEELYIALNEIPEKKMPKFSNDKPRKVSIRERKSGNAEKNEYFKGENVATREAYGRALARLAETNSKIIAVDAEVSNSTHSDYVKKTRPDQFIESFIAEQNLAGVCLGLSKKGFNVFGSTFATFFTRAHDQIRMAAMSSGNITFCGSHCGVSIGQDGASQMGLGDIALFRALPDSIVFYPSDAVSMEKIVHNCSKLKGIKFIRSTRAKTPVVYKNSESFKVGDFKVVKKMSGSKVVLVGSGITLHESIKAHEELGIKSSVVDLYCVKPFNSKKFISFVKKNGSKVVVAEDHYSEGGIGEMLASVLVNSGIKLSRLAISGVPHSGKPEELLKKYEIDSGAIVREARKIS